MAQSLALGKFQARLVWLAAVIALVGAMVIAPLTASAKQPTTQDISDPIPLVTGVFFQITEFAVNDAGQLVAVGNVVDEAGTILTDAAGNLLEGIEVPVLDIFAKKKCDVLHLELGPIDLELLGLVVHVDQIVIDIDADPNAGILGSLLCSLAGGIGPLSGLLDAILSLPSGANFIADLLNIVLGL